ncbi:MAG: MotA/TolQ/ExbB proton channel family protein, partial [Kiritimatiellia bacterium]
DFCGQLIVLIQVGMSIISWAVMAGRWWHLSDLRARSNHFVNDFVRTDDPLALYYNRYAFSDSPMENVYSKTCERLANLIPEQQRLLLRENPTTPLTLGAARMELVETTCAHVIDEETVQLGKGMTALAVITSSAPLLGLFGTVWGVMLAFQAMAASGSANIAELAPGISSALLTTVVGLVVAIPSTIAYNFLQARIEGYTVQLEGFGEELMGKLTLNYRHAEGQ